MVVHNLYGVFAKIRNSFSVKIMFAEFKNAKEYKFLQN